MSAYLLDLAWLHRSRDRILIKPLRLQTLRVPTSITEQEEVQVEVTRLLVECYFDIVRANLQVPQLPLTCLCLQQYHRHLPF